MKFALLNQFSETEILDTHNKAFSDYEVPMQLSLERFLYFNRRRGVRYDLSIGAIVEDKLIGFILNAVDMWNGKLTAYDCGTGIISEFRQKGVGNQIFNHLLPILQKENIEQYLLEVIQTNYAAINLYRKRNFLITREFDCLNVERNQLINNFQEYNIHGRQINIRELKSIDWNVARKFWNFPPSWQNSELSIQRVDDSFNYLGAFYSNKLVGYMVYESTGGITQLAVHPDYRNQQIGQKLLTNMMNSCSHIDNFHIINVDKRDTILLHFLEKLGFKSFTSQFEMILNLI